MFLLRNRFSSAAFASALLAGLASVGCSQHDYVSDQRDQRAVVQQLEQHYPKSSRLRTILEEQTKYSAGADRVKFLAAHSIALDLSADGLPDGTAIRLFKTRWQINPFLAEEMQGWAVNLAIIYAQGQAKDRLAYGVGESFSVVSGALSPVGTTPLSAPRP